MKLNEIEHILEIKDSPFKSEYYKDSFKFIKNKEELGIIDFYNGKLPIVLNEEFFESGKLDVMHCTTIILDSNVLDGLNQYINSYEKMNNDRKEVIENFLLHVSTVNCDYTPIFCLLENKYKSSKEIFLTTSAKKLTSLLKFHSMDSNIFKESKKIEPKKEALEHYYKLYNASNLEECGKNWASKFYNYNTNEYNDLVDLSYICILKMILIHYINPKINSLNIINKYYEFNKFMLDKIGIYLGRENILSLYYFAGLVGKFISIQPNTKYENAIDNLKSTSWDLTLLKLPEMLMNPHNLPEINTSFIATFEKKLFDFGKLFNIDKLIYTQNNWYSIPIISFNYEIFSEYLEKEHFDEILLENEKIINERRKKENIKHISKYDLKCLIENLENQLYVFLMKNK